MEDFDGVADMDGGYAIFFEMGFMLEMVGRKLVTVKD